MISADDYIVQVQDFGELLEYRYNDYAKARHLMDVEALPCSLWACCRATGERVQLENRMTRWPCSAEPVVKRPALWYNQSTEAGPPACGTTTALPRRAEGAESYEVRVHRQKGQRAE